MENMEQKESVSNSRKRQMTGVIVSDKMDKTIVVRVERKLVHPKYKKFVRKSAKYHVHDEDNTYRSGQKVIIQESRPYSKNKCWIVVGEA
jgi:small subunit ribosomal protein S17